MDKKIEKIKNIKLEDIIKNFPEAIFIKDTERKYFLINSPAAKLIGLPKSKVIGKTAEQVFDKKFAKTIHSADMKNLQGKKVDIIRTLNIKGEDYYLNTIQVPIKDKKGKVIGITGSVRDVTEKRELEGYLKKIKGKAERYLALAGNAIVALDIKGNIKLLNKKGYKILGYKYGSLQGSSWIDTCIPPEDRKEMRNIFTRVARGGDNNFIKHYENNVITKKGERRLLSWYNTLIKKDGKVMEILSSGDDITKKREAEEELKESEQRLKEVTENAKKWIWEVNEKGLYIYSNHSVFNILGYKAEELVGKKYFYDFFDSKERAKKKEDSLKLFKKKQSFNGYINKNIHKDGSVVVLSTSGKPILSKDGKLLGYRGLDMDITEQQEIEKVRSEFISVASHQLKTPLAEMKWSIELLEEECEGMGKKEKDLFGNIKDSNNRIMDMVSSLLDISRVESGKKMEINKANFKVSKIIYNILKEEENLIKKYKVKIIKEKSLVKDVNIKVDKDRIKQVFHNIIVNAIKYSHPKGVVKIGIKSRNKKDIIYFVKDNGIGIPARQQDKVFDKFFRGSNVWESGEDGTGLGLHIAKLLVEIHKGKIWLESNKQGTTFYISLPIK